MLQRLVKQFSAHKKTLSFLATIGFLCLMVVTAVNCKQQQNKPEEKNAPTAPTPIGQKVEMAPDFTLKDSHGVAVKLSDLRGKVVVLDFWATWCGPCKVTIPEMNKLAQKYQDKGVVILGISMDEDGWDAVNPFLQKVKFEYPVLLSEPDKMKGYDDRLEALPTAIIIDKEGKIRQMHEGITNTDVFEREIEALL